MGISHYLLMAEILQIVNPWEILTYQWSTSDMAVYIHSIGCFSPSKKERATCVLLSGYCSSSAFMKDFFFKSKTIFKHFLENVFLWKGVSKHLTKKKHSWFDIAYLHLPSPPFLCPWPWPSSNHLLLVGPLSRKVTPIISINPALNPWSDLYSPP